MYGMKRKAARMEIRLPTDELREVAEAAAEEGAGSLSEWVRRALAERAARARDRESSDEEVEAARAARGALAGERGRRLRERVARVRASWRAR
jgi:metal-responsive CopG/Arc/MetJ family transcriptional regulator